MSFALDKKLRITTANKNNYLVNRSLPQVILLHPVLTYLMKHFTDAASIEKWMNGLQENEEVEIQSGYTVPQKDIRYYFKYYVFLEENGYFSDAKKKELTGSTYSSESVEFLLANSRQIVLEVCDTCGLDCKYCGYGDLYNGHDKREGKRMAPETAKRFLDYVMELQTSPLNRQSHKEIVLSFYGGEPTDNMALIKEMVRYSRTKSPQGRPFLFFMTTNALNLDRHMDYLVENRFQLLISLDGNETNNSYRTKKNGEPSFNRVFNNIRKLKEKHPDYFEHFVRFNAVIHNRNSRKDAVAFIQKHFGKEPLLSELSWMGLNPERREEFEKMFKQRDAGLEKKDYDAFAKDKDKILNSPLTSRLFFFFRAYSGLVFKNYDKLLNRDEIIRYATPGTCHPFEKKAFLTVNGKILPCERIPQKYSLGTVDEHGVTLDYSEISASYNRYHEKLKTKCNQCFRIDNCPTCIFSLDLDSETPTCKYFMTEEEFKKDLGDCLTVLENNPQFYSRIMNDYVRV